MSTRAGDTLAAMALMLEGAPAPVDEFPLDDPPNGEVSLPEDPLPNGDVVPPDEPDDPDEPGTLKVGLSAVWLVLSLGHTSWPSPAPASTAATTTTEARPTT